MFTNIYILGNVLSKDKELSLKELIVSAINIINATMEICPQNSGVKGESAIMWEVSKNHAYFMWLNVYFCVVR